MLRLTLRTLLAYLDDTLEPLEIKTIGQKVAESETAQELIARIKQATRRRRITTPPATGPNSFDPNMVADYLDNELPSEQVAELEKICLESDVHLAEVASCHQILTLVLGEPASVPPTAKERMYALVHGREAIPFRKAAAAAGNAATPSAADHDADEMFLLGLPFYRRGSWLRWALPLAALVLFVVVGVALWQSINGLQTQPNRQAEVADNRKPNTESGDNAKPPDKDSDKPITAVAQPATPDKTSGKTPDPNEAKKPNGGSSTNPADGGETKPTPKPEIIPETKPSASRAVREEKPDPARVKVGLYHIEVNKPSLLVQRKDEKDDWHRAELGKDVFSSDQLVSLPGYASEVRLDCGVHLLLRGHIPEFTPAKKELLVMNHLHDSTIVLHKPKDTDADLTLLRGRLYLSNHKQEAVVARLRFENKVWDLTLQPGSEFAVDLIKRRDAGWPPASLFLLLLHGKAGIALENDQIPHLSTDYFYWNSVNPSQYLRSKVSQQDLDKDFRLVFAKTPLAPSKEADHMEQALAALQRRMTPGRSPLVVLQEVLGEEKPYEHRLAIYCFAALDGVKELMDILGSNDPIHAADRFIAFVALRRWLDRGPEQTLKLFNPKTGTGWLMSQLRYTSSDAEKIIELLNDPTDDQILKAETYDSLARELLSDQVAIAELARLRLIQLSEIAGVRLPKVVSFNAALPRERRAEAKDEVIKKLEERLLPPALNPRPPGPGGPTPPKGNGTKPDTRPKR